MTESEFWNISMEVDKTSPKYKALFTLKANSKFVSKRTGPKMMKNVAPIDKFMTFATAVVI